VPLFLPRDALLARIYAMGLYLSVSVSLSQVGVLLKRINVGLLDDAVASYPKIKIDATGRSLKYSD